MSSTAINEIKMYRGNDKTINLVVKRNNNLYDISSCVITMYIKQDRSHNDSDAIITKEGTIVDAENGQVEFYLVPSDTEEEDRLEDDVSYPVYFKLVTPLGKKYTVLRSWFTLKSL